MKVKFYTIGKIVYEKKTYHDGTVNIIKIRVCNTAEEAKAVANYYNIRQV